MKRNGQVTKYGEQLIFEPDAEVDVQRPLRVRGGEVTREPGLRVQPVRRLGERGKKHRSRDHGARDDEAQNWALFGLHKSRLVGEVHSDFDCNGTVTDGGAGAGARWRGSTEPTRRPRD